MNMLGADTLLLSNAAGGISHNLFVDENAAVILIADRFSEEVQNVVTINNRNNKLNLLLAESDGFGLSSYDIYDDMALLLDTKILSLDASSPFALQNVTVDNLAQVAKAILSPQQTVLYDKRFSRDEVQEKKEELLEDVIALTASGGERMGEIRQLKKRLMKYAKSATIWIGGLTEAERRERKDRAEDAVLAISSAVNDGVIPGGGAVLYNARKETSSKLMQDWCAEPVTVMVSNSDKLEEVLEAFRAGYAINYKTWETGNFLELGIVDPAQALIKAVTQALVITRTILGSKSMIVPTVDYVN